MTVAGERKNVPCRMETKREIISASGHDRVNEIRLMASFTTNNGGRRLGIDRRQFSYDKYIPERRSDKDRRSGIDRRKKTRAT